MATCFLSQLNAAVLRREGRGGDRKKGSVRESASGAGLGEIALSPGMRGRKVGKEGVGEEPGMARDEQLERETVARLGTLCKG